MYNTKFNRNPLSLFWRWNTWRNW